MTYLHDLILDQAATSPDSLALGYKDQWLSYQQLSEKVRQTSAALLNFSVANKDRVAIYLPKSFEAVITAFAASHAGLVFVPINPILKATQAEHILMDSDAKVLITNSARLKQLSANKLAKLEQVILIDNVVSDFGDIAVHTWQQATAKTTTCQPFTMISTDLVALFYTSGSTGKPKGVMLSHQNMVCGAKSVACYLKQQASDRVLSVLPLSFDYGFSQLTVSFVAGGSCYMMEYLFPQDIIKQVVKQSISGLALVPPLWIKLMNMSWPDSAQQTLRYFTNSGGAMPTDVTEKIHQQFPQLELFLMYGLTEAFRSSYLSPKLACSRPDSMGKAIPDAELMVLNRHGDKCAADEVGELVHRGPLVSLGYWKNKAQTQLRFKPLPQALTQGPLEEIAVWSGDMVKQDKDGFLYFVGRSDEMIKTSGYRVSPQEVEGVVFASGLVSQAVAVGVPHPELGQAILLFVDSTLDGVSQQINIVCSQQLPSFMVPTAIIELTEIPSNSNGKPDRAWLYKHYQQYFENQHLDH
ncbi:MAG: acyl-CoA ligase (AMP-forming), exosortase A system-associated [Parashewanella sp.]